MPRPSRIFDCHERPEDVASGTITSHDGDAKVEVIDVTHVWSIVEERGLRKRDFAKLDAFSALRSGDSRASRAESIPRQNSAFRGNRDRLPDDR